MERDRFMSVFRKVGDAFYRLMYGRNGMDQLGLAMIWGGLILDIVTMLVARQSAILGKVFYWVGIALWIAVLFRIFSRNVTRRQEENSRWLALTWRMKNGRQEAKERRADTEHKYFTCKNCKTICRVPAGKGKIVITCPKCGKEIRGKS